MSRILYVFPDRMKRCGPETTPDVDDQNKSSGRNRVNIRKINTRVAVLKVSVKTRVARSDGAITGEGYGGVYPPNPSDLKSWYLQAVNKKI